MAALPFVIILPRAKRSFLSGLLVFYFVLTFPLFAQDSGSEALSNERIPVSAEALQVHWQIDCHQYGAKLLALVHHNRLLGFLLNDPNQLQRQLQMCSIVHQRFWAEAYPCNLFAKILSEYKRITALDALAVATENIENGSGTTSTTDTAANPQGWAILPDECKQPYVDQADGIVESQKSHTKK